MSLVDKIILLADKHKWHLHSLQPQPEVLLRFVKKDKMIDVWFTKMTVGTYLNHPKHGKTQLFRRNVSMKSLEAIFINPRSHLGTGYRHRKRGVSQ